MRQLTKGKAILLLIAIGAIAILAVVFFNLDFSATRALADDVTVHTIDDDLSFALRNNGTEYKVSARNKSITRIRIPKMYNGLPVTEIKDNGFMSCAKLEYVYIPDTVTRIGVNAFMNCKKLVNVDGMTNVESLCNNAFAMCPVMNETIVPFSVAEFGNGVFRGNANKVIIRKTESEMNELNADWKSGSNSIFIYGNELVIDDIYGDDGSTVIGYAINKTQNLYAPDVDFVLGDSYNGLPLVEIGDSAFSGSELNSFTLKHGDIVPDADNQNNTELFAVSNCTHTVNIKSNAFTCLFAQNINLTVNITFNDDTYDDDSCMDFEKGYSTSIFSGSTARGIMLPDNLTVIPRSMFANCENLREITNVTANVDVNRLSSNITTICSDAFAWCTSIINLYISDSVINMGSTVFDSWGGSDIEQTLHFDNMYVAPVGKDGYNWNEYWLGETYGNLTVDFKTFIVVLDKTGGSGGTDFVKAYYGQPMPAAQPPKLTGYYFRGYYYNGKQYYDENMNSMKSWDVAQDAALLAKWQEKDYDVYLDMQGGADGAASVIATYDNPMPTAQKPEKKGYEFLGYYTQPNGGGTKYYNADMTSAQDWDIPQDGVSLYAHWEIIDFILTVYYNDTVLYTCDTTHYGDDMSTLNIPLPVGLVIRGIYDTPDLTGNKYYDNEMNAAISNYNVTYDLNLYVMRMETHVIYIGGAVNSGNPSTVYYMDEVILKPASKRGYVFVGWYMGSQKITKLQYRTEEEITLTAVFEGHSIAVTPTTNEVEVSGHAYVYISLPSKLNRTCRIYVDSDVLQLYVYSAFNNVSYDMNIIIRNRTTDFTIKLENVSIAPTHNYCADILPAIAMYTDNDSRLLLHAYGNVTIKGTNGLATSGEDGGTAIYCSTLDICSADKLTLRGGKGGTNAKGDNGGNGGNAVYAEEIIKISRSAKVNACGGDHATIAMSANPYEIKSGRGVIDY